MGVFVLIYLTLILVLLVGAIVQMRVAKRRLSSLQQLLKKPQELK